MVDIPAIQTHAYKQRVLDRVRVASHQVIPQYVAQTARFDMVEYLGDNLLISVISEMLREHIVSETQSAELEAPATWWQHFKADHRDKWWSRWYLRRWPVVYTTWVKRVTFNRYHDYPDARMALPEKTFGRPVIYETTFQTDWETA